MRNIDFPQSELIKSEVDEMEDPSYHFESADSTDPICGRNISDNELSVILEILKKETRFSIEYDDSNEEDLLAIYLPLSREALISAEIEQELFYAWDEPCVVSWNNVDCIWPRGVTEYRYSFDQPKLPKSSLAKKRLPDFYKEQLFRLFFKNPKDTVPREPDKLNKSKLLRILSRKSEIRNCLEAEKRLDFELDIIRKVGLEQYVLAFDKILSLAKRKHRPMFVDSLDGEGSLVLYCLGITRRNPLQYGLGFASFLSMERVRIPWFGIICRKKDTRSIYSEMVKQFGENKVGLIPNGVGLLLNKTDLGEPVPYVIDDYTLERNFLVQPEDVEKNGIAPVPLEFDQTLNDLFRIEGLIRQYEPDFSLESIPDDDSETFAMLSKGETEGISLLDDNWIRKCLSILEPSNIDDLDVLMSLYHNGPTDLIPMYMDAKRGMQPQEYQALQEIDPLKRTHGVIVYKEQIVDVLIQIARFSEADALLFCRALSLGNRGAVDKYETNFKESMAIFCGNCKYAEKLIDMIRRFSPESYKRKVGFWHAVLSYRLAFIKCHFPDEFDNVMILKTKED